MRGTGSHTESTRASKLVVPTVTKAYGPFPPAMATKMITRQSPAEFVSRCTPSPWLRTVRHCLRSTQLEVCLLNECRFLGVLPTKGASAYLSVHKLSLPNLTPVRSGCCCPGGGFGSSKSLKGVRGEAKLGDASDKARMCPFSSLVHGSSNGMYGNARFSSLGCC